MTDGVALMRSPKASGNMVFYVDLGASEHICNNKEGFTILKPLEEPKKFEIAGGEAISTSVGIVSVLADPKADQHVLFGTVFYMADSPAVRGMLSGSSLADYWYLYRG
jgi:hypothetical protein